MSDDGKTADKNVDDLSMLRSTVYRWRTRYERLGRDGLDDRYRSGRPRTLAMSNSTEILRLTVESIPREATHRSFRLMAEYAEVSRHQVKQVWDATNPVISTRPLGGSRIAGITGLSRRDRQGDFGTRSPSETQERH